MTTQNLHKNLFLLRKSQFPLKGVRLNAELGINFHNFFVFWIWMMQFGTERTNGCYFLVLKGFFANINMKLKNPMDPSEGVVELAME